MLQAIGPTQNRMNIKSQPLSLTNTISPTLILYTPLSIVTARDLILSYHQNKIFMQFNTYICPMFARTFNFSCFITSDIPNTRKKSHYWLQNQVQSKHFFNTTGTCVYGTQNGDSQKRLCIHIPLYFFFVDFCDIRTHRHSQRKIQQGATMYQHFIIPYVYKPQQVSGDTPPIIRSLKLHWQPLVFYTWKVAGRVVGGQRPPTTRPTTFHYKKPEAASAILGS
jgi:hypothetical protein